MRARFAWARPSHSGCLASRRRPPVLQCHPRHPVAAAAEQSRSCGSCGTSGSGGGAAAANGASAGNGSSAPSQATALVSECSAPCSVRPRPAMRWPQKSEIDLLRSDGHSCTRETVQPGGNLQFACPSSQQQLLVWRTPPKRAMVLKKLGGELLPELVSVIEHLGRDLGLRAVVEPHDYELLEGRECLAWVDTYDPADLPALHAHLDFVVCLGGDGLLLHAAALLGPALPPLISFKLGSLGFLTTHRRASSRMHGFEDFPRHLAGVVHGCRQLDSCQLLAGEDGRPRLGVHITLRMRLECEIWRGGASEAEERLEVLNEVSLSRGAHPYLSKIEVSERGVPITVVQADGVMLATPTGSTAYNVAAGGSLVHPSVPAILLTPICPHSLNFRPIILPDYVELQLRIAPDSRSPALACFDGRQSRELAQGDSIRVRMSRNPVPTINSTDMTTDWISSIQRCFQWSERVEQKAFDAAAAPSPQLQAAPQQAGGAANGSGSGGLPSAGSELSEATLLSTASSSSSSSSSGGGSSLVSPMDVSE